MNRIEAIPVKTRAVEDARQMQARVNEQCMKEGKDPPPYGLEELIGKGSFGRVYKGKDMRSAAVVAIKIIDIDASDTQDPRNADSYSDVLKEIAALSTLSETKAKNINFVIEALVIGQSMWLVTEYCSGGSVATLMKPTFPAGLQEKWIIPILREVVEALRYVHAAGIIHRDIKCANVLITEVGGVQLCDFGIAGVIENKVDKRSTIIGTPHWMAPELLTGSASYGKEVDIWAFGSMVYEIATGLPPNVANGIPYERLGSYLKQHVPRLEGDQYSSELCSLVAYCLEEEPQERPSIEEVQKHPYIFNTSSKYPTSSLRALVASFKIWESRGGSRKSLFMQHGSQGLSSDNNVTDEWNFSTTEFFDREVLDEFGTKDVYDTYGYAVLDFDESTAKPKRTVRPSRRRGPPEALSRLPVQPLEKIFDPNTLSNYDDNSRAQYGGAMIRQQQSDLPLRDNSAQPPIRDTMIDLGDHVSGTGISSFSGSSTIRAERKAVIDDESYSPTTDLRRTSKSDPADLKKNRRTQDWKFPTLSVSSVSSESSRFPSIDEIKNPPATATGVGSNSMPHHNPVLVDMFGGSLKPESGADRMSMQSLIDLDMSLPDPVRDYSRPPTSRSEANTLVGDQASMMNPFEFERHQSIYYQLKEREPSLYVNEDDLALFSENICPPELPNASDISTLVRNGVQTQMPNSNHYKSINDDNTSNMSLPDFPPQNLHEITRHPSGNSLIGTASDEEMKAEFIRILEEMTQRLCEFRDCYEKFKSPVPMKLNNTVSDDQESDIPRRSFTE
ncbi:Serine/threonine-protein kinase nak1 [Erysiphe necator]|nr:Serine/threonine-protein kinase nak1 [Erysiphe necator]